MSIFLHFLIQAPRFISNKIKLINSIIIIISLCSVAIALTLLSVILFGSMGGERTNLFNPILALLIIGFVLMALAGGVRIFVSGSDHSYPIVLIVANAGNRM